MHLAWKSIWSWKCQLKAFRWIQKPVCKRRSHESPRLVLYVRLYALGHRISCRHCQAARWRRGKSFSCKIFCHWTRRDREVASTRLLSLSDSTNPRTAPRKRSSGIRRAWTRILLRSAGLISDMITSNIRQSQNIHHQVFGHQLSNNEILWPGGVGWQIWSAERSSLYKLWFLKNCLVHGRRNMEKIDREIFKPSPGGWNLTMPSELRSRTTTSDDQMSRSTI